MRCSYCERETDVLVTYADGVSVCLDCKAAERDRIEAAFADVYGPEYAELATYQRGGPMTRKPYQDTDEWREERRGGYGASDAPILVEGDEAAWQHLHGEKLGIVPGRVANETMEWGKRLEDVIARAYAERTGVALRRVNRLVRHPDLPYVFASLDRMSPGNRPVEIKKWGFKTDAFGPEGSDIVPTSWLYQVQQQAAVTGADAIEIAVLFAGSKLEAFTVGRDESLIAEIIGLETAAWAFVLRGEMPPYPGQAPKRVVLAEDEVEVDEVIAAVRFRSTTTTPSKRRPRTSASIVEGLIRELLADAGGAKGVLPDGRRVTIAHRPQADRESVAWELVAKAYRKAIEENDTAVDEQNEMPLLRLDLDAIESMFTTTKPGARPLRITIREGHEMTLPSRQPASLSASRRARPSATSNRSSCKATLRP